MRVISGEKKGHKLKAPKGREARPTEDRIKESLFNILRSIKEEAIVLDLFAGSGSIGIEFLSRGAKIAYLVDVSANSIDAIKDNLNHTNLLDKSVIINKDAIKALNFFKKQNIRFDYIYLDPPFKDHDLLYKSLELIFENKLLLENGIIIIEYEKALSLESDLFSFTRFDFRNYGNKSISFYKEV